MSRESHSRRHLGMLGVLITCAAVLVALGASASAFAADKKAKAPKVKKATLALVGTSLGTSQALIWDRELRSYMMLELGDEYRGFVVEGVGRDFMTLRTTDGKTVVSRLVTPRDATAAPLSMAPGALDGDAGRVPVTHLPAIDVSEPETALPPPPPAAPEAEPMPTRSAVVISPATPPAPVAPPAAVVAPAAEPHPSRHTPKTPVFDEPVVLPAPAPVAMAPAPAAAPAPVAAAPTLSRLEIRKEVSATISGERPYRATAVPGAGYRMTGVEGTALERAGLRDGDILRSVNGIPATSYSEMMRAYASLYTADAVALEIDRAGARLAMTYGLTF